MALAVTVPPGSPAGLLIVTGKHRVILRHQPFMHHGFLAWDVDSIFCGAEEAFRSLFSVPAAEELVHHQQTVTTHAAFPVGAGGGTFTLHLSSTLSNPTLVENPDDQVGDDFITVAFHTTP